MSQNTPAIEFKNLQKHFKSGKKVTKAVDGVSFSVPTGEIFGFLGPNGAGKTTTIRCMMDFIRPTKGDITILDKDAHKSSIELKKEIGYLSGNVQFNKNWTGQEHINYLAKINGGSGVADDLIERLNFNPLMKTKQLSSGNRQKLGIILALMNNPKLIVLDEPTNALDPLLQQTVYTLLEEARERGATIFMSSHNLPEVERICNRVAIIRNGKIITTEAISSLREKRLYTVKAQFETPINASDMHFSDTTIEQLDEKTIKLSIKSKIAPILQRLSQLPLIDIEVHPASLEEIFLEHYEN